jgi:8-oxo-dGTP pyrophosphatase MutT (NUDIX family)
MQEYVAGFAFSEDLQNVLLIQKNKPEWQAGLLNRIGGKIEPNEGPLAAMIREFEEETGLKTSKWQNTVILTGKVWQVYFFRTKAKDLSKAKSLTDERVIPIPVHEIWNLDVIPNLRWLIPMQLDKLRFPIQIFDRG